MTERENRTKESHGAWVHGFSASGFHEIDFDVTYKVAFNSEVG